MQRSLGLDFLRSGAILFVMLCHSIYIIYDIVPGLIGNVLLQYGGVGVDLFFVLSGFLIGRIFLKEVVMHPGENIQKMKHFWKRRWFRTLPNYYLFFLIHLILVMLGFGKDQSGHTAYVLQSATFSELIKFPFFLQNFISIYPSFFAQSWSLCVEEWFYLLLPAVFFGYLRFKGAKSPRAICRFLFITVLVLIIWKWACYFLLHDFYFPGKVIFNFDQILIGVLLGALYFFYEEQVKSLRLVSLIIGVAMFLIANFIMVKFLLISHPLPGVDLIMRLSFTLSFALLTLYFVDFKASINKFTQLITTISQSSYSMYLSHMLILLIFVDRFLLKIPILADTSWGRMIIFVLFLIVTIFISYINFIMFERPIMNLRDKRINFKKPVEIVK
jgi:peptidoglycan/LPS O-acetylase OafA/YrhL